VARLRLTLACGDYDRTRALEEGTIRPDGIDLTYLRLPVEETFFRMIRHREFEVAEMSLSTYTVSLQRDPPPFIALPVFPSRMFRHGCIYINANVGITTPEDLRGKTVGTPEYQLTAGVWIRGILADHHHVPVDSVTYLVGGQEEPGRPEKAALDLPDRIRVQRIRADMTLSGMLARRRRTPLRLLGAALHAAMADPAARAGQTAARRRLLVLRPARQPRHPRHLPALPPRAGTVTPATAARGALRPRGDRVRRHLTPRAGPTGLHQRGDALSRMLCGHADHRERAQCNSVGSGPSAAGHLR